MLSGLTTMTSGSVSSLCSPPCHPYVLKCNSHARGVLWGMHLQSHACGVFFVVPADLGHYALLADACHGCGLRPYRHATHASVLG